MSELRRHRPKRRFDVVRLRWLAALVLGSLSLVLVVAGAKLPLLAMVAPVILMIRRD